MWVLRYGSGQTQTDTDCNTSMEELNNVQYHAVLDKGLLNTLLFRNYFIACVVCTCINLDPFQFNDCIKQQCKMWTVV